MRLRRWTFRLCACVLAGAGLPIAAGAAVHPLRAASRVAHAVSHKTVKIVKAIL